MRDKRFFSFVRNASCGLLACGLILSGRVRRGLKRAFEDGAVTAIYFHNPNRELFSVCVKWLMRRQYKFISTRELIEILHRGSPVPRGAVWLSLDDGFRDMLRNVIPVVREHRIPVTIFLPSGIVGGDGLYPWLEGRHRGREAMTEAEAVEIASYPEVTLGAHTVTHTVTPDLPAKRLWYEFACSKRAVELWAGREVDSFAYPEGRFDGYESSFLRKLGYKLAVTTEATLIAPGTDPLKVPRFCVGDNIWLPEAICNMTGEWVPVIGKIKTWLRGWGSSTPYRGRDTSASSPQFTH